MLLEFAESGHPIFRATTPGVFSRANDMEDFQYTSLQIIQQDRSGEPEILMGQSINCSR